MKSEFKFITYLLALFGIEKLTLNKEGKLDISDTQMQKLKEEDNDKADAIIKGAEAYLVYEKELQETKQELIAKKSEATQKDAEIEALRQELYQKETVIETLSHEPEQKKPMDIIKSDFRTDQRWRGGRHTAAFAFGLEHEFYATSKWYNRLAIDKKPEGKRTKKEIALLDEEFGSYGEALSKRIAELHNTGELQRLAAAGDIDYTDLASALGSYYYVRRQDALISYILNLPTVTNVFPLHFGIQDGEVLIDSFEGRSFSQPYQSGEIASGSFKMAPHIAQVKDVMFKYKFTDLKGLETQYIGYLNREGSSPIKFSFIEWIVSECAKIINNEKNVRRIKGVRVEPTPSSAAHFNYASDGVLTTLERYIHENRVYVFEDKNEYSVSTIIDYFKAMAQDFERMLGIGTSQGYSLYFNANHKNMYLDGYREKYKTNLDFNGELMEIKNAGGINLKLIPNMGNDRYDVFITKDSNFEILELVAGEMFNLYFERRLETMWACSYGKEGSAAVQPGKAETTLAAKLAAEGHHTIIFANKPYTALLADATAAVAADNRYFRTIANSGATSFLGFTGAKPGVLYKLECGSLTNATAIAKAAKFSTLTSAWTPAAVGDYIRVIYDPTGDKFYDYDRVTNGVYAKNTALIAPAYVESI
jgi:hypothetical protein